MSQTELKIKNSTLITVFIFAILTVSCRDSFKESTQKVNIVVSDQAISSESEPQDSLGPQANSSGTGTPSTSSSWNDILDDTNRKPTAKDAYIEPEKDKKLRIGLEAFLASDGDGDTLTLSVVDQQGKESSLYQDQFTIISRVPGNPSQLEIQSSLIGATSVVIRISDGKASSDVTLTISPKNPLSAFRPALAVNKAQCLLCHSQIKGNFVSSLGTDQLKTTIGFHNSESRDSESRGREFDYMFGDYVSYYSKSLFMTSYFDGTIFVPNRKLSSSAQAQAQSLISEGLEPQVIKANSPSLALFDYSSAPLDMLSQLKGPKTGAQYLFSMLQFQNKDFVDVSKSWYGINKSTQRNANIVEVQDINISAPSEEVIKQKVKSGETYSYYAQGSGSASLKNFGVRPVRRGLMGQGKVLFGNNPSEVMECDGDLFVKGAVFLKDLRLRTKVGCRIHATGVVFVSGSIADNSKPEEKSGYVLVDPTENSNLEIVSSRAILMGLGYVNPNLGGVSGSVSPLKRLLAPGFGLPSGTMEDVDLFVGSSAQDSIVFDAGTDPAKGETSYGGFLDARRKVSFERLLVNAPVIHSRYSGDFKGVVISDFALWSLGQFKYEYDPIFDRVPVLPMIDGSNYFAVTQCSESMKVMSHANLSECR